MNSFLFRLFLFCLFLSPTSVGAQSGTASSHPLHPLQLLTEPANSKSYLQISYVSPYGIRSFQDFRIRYKQTLSTGFLGAEIQRLGINGFAEYQLSFAYTLDITKNIFLGLSLNSLLLPSFSSGKLKLIPGSSIYSGFGKLENFQLYLFLDNWTSLWSREGVHKSYDTCLSIISKIKTDDRINIICGLAFTQGRLPVFRAGVNIRAGDNHGIIGGMQTGPAGFWFGYNYSMARMNFSFSIQTSGVFGYEPGTSFQYFLNK